MLDGRALVAGRAAAPTCSSTAPGRCGPRSQSLQYRLDVNGLHRDDAADDARAQRDRPRVVPLHRAAAGRRLHHQPDHRQLHHHRPDHQRRRSGPASSASSPPTHASPNVVLPRRAADPGAPLRRARARPGPRSCSPGCPGSGKSTIAAGGRGGLRDERPAGLHARRRQPAPRHQRRPRLLRPGPHGERAPGRRGRPHVRRVGLRWP